MRTFAVHNHQGKATGLIGALVMAGWNLVDGLSSRADVLLIDHDGTPYYRDIINQVNAKKTVLFQHGAESFVTYDGLYEANPRTDAMLVQPPMAKTILQEINYPKPVYVTGWYWTEVKPLEVPEGRKTIFAPLHPRNDGTRCTWKQNANNHVFSQLIKQGERFTCRYIGDLYRNGLYDHPLVDFEKATAETMIPDILRHDLIVSSGTFAHLAVALGKAVVMYGQDHIPTDDRGLETDDHWDDYAAKLRYPFCFEGFDDDAERVISEAVRNKKVRQEWRDRWIGKQLNPWRLSETLERICHADL